MYGYGLDEVIEKVNAEFAYCCEDAAMTPTTYPVVMLSYMVKTTGLATTGGKKPLLTVKLVVARMAHWRGPSMPASHTWKVRL